MHIGPTVHPMPSQTQRLALLESLTAALSLGIIVLDSARRVVLWNGWMAQHTGLAPAAVLGHDLFSLFGALGSKRVEGAVQQALRDNFPSVLSQTLHKAPFPLFASSAARAEGVRIQQAVAVTPLALAGAARHCLIQITDVSVAVQRERLLRDQSLELREQSFSDGLTGIANRRHFDIALDKELRRAKRAGAPLSLLMIDIDSFKAYNDCYGHQQGDDTLIRVAAALSAMLQRPHDLIARYGGEEFAVILPELDSAQARQMAEAMRLRVAGLQIAHAGAPGVGYVTVSIGIATGNDAHASAQQPDLSLLLGAADRSLYDAKRAGRNQVMAQAIA